MVNIVFFQRMAVLAVFLPFSCLAANHYVRAGATGSGSGNDWSNAYQKLPSTLVRGDTYYIADGSYGSYTFKTPKDGAKMISIKKATVSDHGTGVGWGNQYGDGVAHFTNWTFDTGYWLVDGVTGGGPGSWESGHGIKLTTDGCSSKAIRMHKSGLSNITIKHIEATMSNVSCPSGIVYAHGEFDGVGATDVHFSHVYFHRVYGPVFHHGYGDRWTVEYSKLGDINPPGSPGTAHAEIFSLLGGDDWTIRYNWLYSWRSTGGIVAINGAAGTSDQNFVDDMHIYGNVFDQDAGAAYRVQSAIRGGSNYQYARRWRIFNNTYIDLNSSSTGVSFSDLATYGGGADNQIRNNVACGNIDTITSSQSTSYNSVQNPVSGFFIGNGDEDISGIPCTSIFVDYNGNDFRLASDSLLSAGTALSEPFNVDMYGVVRGADGAWDRGAFEFTEDGSSPPTSMPTPLNLRVNDGSDS